MENFGGDHEGEFRKLISELAEGRDAAAKLQMILNGPLPAHSDHELLLLHNVISSYNKALAMLNYNNPYSESTHPVPPGPAFGTESSSAFTGSPHSEEDSDRGGDGSRKRKAPRWTQKVQACHESGFEGYPDDGYIWRKYGQKDILGTRYPRGYFRCTHRHAQGCLATKQVQRSDEDPNIFNITYCRNHTCNQPQTGGAASHHQLPPQNPAESQLSINPITQVSQQETIHHHENHPLSYHYFDDFPSTTNAATDHHHRYGFQQHYDPNFGWNASSPSGFGLVEGNQRALFAPIYRLTI
ncbi:unnamed protein product [Cuscuta campestris]|uniref:WRKY domain-containing protein n=1 Tax=Cuscuta campestris TaxID=132261 RepID=A0A484K6A3_9ASTE|nr:unnamed protein product [Cuscuta campestris]